jgi:multidrug efflux system membrane fusion protein
VIARASAKPRNFKRIALSAAALVVAVGGTALYLNREGPEPAHAARSNAGVPVSVVKAVKQDVPVILTGLGTVQASFTVNIHSQVDGKLQEVFFTEGQRVKKGDVLAKIDPRLFQAALDQAKARKAQDAATLAGYEKDLARFQALATMGFDTQQNLDQQEAKVASAKALALSDDAAIETAQTNLDYTNITAPSDGRMGVRLVDPGAVFSELKQLSLVSDAIVPGDIQILGDGTPIVLMRDHQPTGGYPRIATIVSADLDRFAQMRPGTEIRFRPVALEHAR